MLFVSCFLLVFASCGQAEQSIDFKELKEKDGKTYWNDNLCTAKATKNLKERNTKEIIVFKDGEKQTKQEQYADGTLKAETQFVGGQVNGVAKAWHENSKLAAETFFEGGEKIKRHDFYEDGAKKEVKYFVNGKLDKYEDKSENTYFSPVHYARGTEAGIGYLNIKDSYSITLIAFSDAEKDYKQEDLDLFRLIQENIKKQESMFL